MNIKFFLPSPIVLISSSILENNPSIILRESYASLENVNQTQGDKFLKILFNIVLLAAVPLTSCGGGQQREISERRSDLNAEIELTSSPYHSSNGWQKKIELYVDVEANDDIVQATLNAIDKWNDAAGREIIKYQGREEDSSVTSLYAPLNDQRTVLYTVSNWRAATAKDKAVLGTTVWEDDVSDEQTIVRGDILLNTEEYLYQDASKEATDPTRTNDVVDAETVVIHEIGHLLGLNHVDFDLDPDSVMHTHATIGPNQYQRVLSESDISLIQRLYN